MYIGDALCGTLTDTVDPDKAKWYTVTCSTTLRGSTIKVLDFSNSFAFCGIKVYQDSQDISKGFAKVMVFENEVKHQLGEEASI